MSEIQLPTEDNPAVVIQGDALDVLRRIDPGAVAAIITDPPYGIGLKSNAGDSLDLDGYRRRAARPHSIEGDENQAIATAVAEYADRNRLPLAMFGTAYRPYPGEWRNILVWDKGPGVGGGGDMALCWRRDFELVYIRRNYPLNDGRDSAVRRHWISPGGGGGFDNHPCEKPVELMAYLIRKLTKPGDLILDPCCGSGSTLIAAIQASRRAIGIEIDPTHAATARRRIDEALGVGGLFENVKPPTAADLYAEPA